MNEEQIIKLFKTTNLYEIQNILSRMDKLEVYEVMNIHKEVLDRITPLGN